MIKNGTATLSIKVGVSTASAKSLNQCRSIRYDCLDGTDDALESTVQKIRGLGAVYVFTGDGQGIGKAD